MASDIQNAVLSAIRQVMDKDGNFEFDALIHVIGLDRVVVRQAIWSLNQSGHAIIKMKSEIPYYQWQEFYWTRSEG